jgi:hypothetical protein
VAKVHQRDDHPTYPRPVRTLTTLSLLAALVSSSTAVTLSTTGPADAAVVQRNIAYRQFDTDAQLRTGTLSGATVTKGAVTLASGKDRGSWTSPWVTPGFALTELIPSWKATTPGASRLVVEVRGRTNSGATSWDTAATWAYGDRAVRRASGTSQSDDGGRMSYDTWLTNRTTGVTGWQVRVTLARPTGGTAIPRLDSVHAVATRLPATSNPANSKPRPAPNVALGKVLAVPRFSQMVHEGDYPKYDGGGEAWCSPTSTTMVLGYYGALPTAKEYAWVKDGHADPQVDHAARMVYDATLGGTGNWAFNTAYAANRVGKGYVTRLRNLRGIEAWIEKGVPVVVSVTFGRGQLRGAPISSTNGHLLVVVGFTKAGDVVVNDPAAATNKGVRRTYDRAQFEDAWLKRYPSGGSLKGSGGVAYVITR